MKINNHPIYNDGNQACYVVLMYAYLFIIIIIFFLHFVEDADMNASICEILLFVIRRLRLTFATFR